MSVLGDLTKHHGTRQAQWSKAKENAVESLFHPATLAPMIPLMAIPC
jgi:hypothetical protein